MANPTAMLLSSCNMLNHVGLEYYGNMIQSAVERVLKVGKVKFVNVILSLFDFLVSSFAIMSTFRLIFMCWLIMYALRFELRTSVVTHLQTSLPWQLSTIFDTDPVIRVKRERRGRMPKALILVSISDSLHGDPISLNSPPLGDF